MEQGVLAKKSAKSTLEHRVIEVYQKYPHTFVFGFVDFLHSCFQHLTSSLVVTKSRRPLLELEPQSGF
jgi:hypothetical protein